MCLFRKLLHHPPIGSPLSFIRVGVSIRIRVRFELRIDIIIMTRCRFRVRLGHHSSNKQILDGNDDL